MQRNAIGDGPEEGKRYHARSPGDRVGCTRGGEDRICDEEAFGFRVVQKEGPGEVSACEYGGRSALFTIERDWRVIICNEANLGAGGICALQPWLVGRADVDGAVEYARPD